MNTGLPQDAAEVLDFWFAGCEPGTSRELLEQRNAVWFGPDPAVDRDIERQFADALARAERGECDHWSDSARGMLALIVVLDQFTRNMHRGSARAFANDDAALALCRGGLDQGVDRSLSFIERAVFYLPLQHAEDRATQDLSVELAERLAAEAPPPVRDYYEKTADFAREHRDIVQRFGRFPHRNEVLERESTPQESAYLNEGAPRFGQ